MARPALKVEIAFGFTWQSTPPLTWTDVTAYVLDDDVALITGHGRDSDTLQAGTGRIRLRNRDDRFTPGNLSSPYTYVVPLVPVRVTGAWSGTKDVWYGYARRWVPNWDNPSDAYCILECVDAFRIFGETQIESDYTSHLLSLAPTYFWKGDGLTTGSMIPDETTHNHIGSPSGVTFGAGGGVRPVAANGSWDLGDQSTLGYADTTTSGARLSGTSEFTVGFWWDGDSHDMTGGLVDYRKFFQQAYSASNYVFVAYYSASNQIHFVIYNGVTTQTCGTPVSYTSDDGPLFIVARRTSGQLQLYVNGALSGVVISSALSITASTQRWAGAQGTSQQQMKGRMSDMFVDTGRAWTGTEIADLYQAGLGWSGDVPSQRLERVLDRAGWPSSARSITTSPTAAYTSTQMDGWPETTDVLSLVQDCVTAAEGDCWIDPAGSLTFVDYRARGVSAAEQLGWILPFGWWILGDLSGTTAVDHSADIFNALFHDPAPFGFSSSNGTYVNTPSLNQPSLLEYDMDWTSCLFASASSQYVNVGDYSQFEGSRWMVGAWVHLTSLGAERPIIAKSDASASDWWLTIDSTGHLQAGYVTAGGTTRTATLTAAMSTLTTYFVCGWYDDNATLGVCMIAPDGTATSTTATTSASDVVRTSTRQVWIARRHNNYMNGLLQHVWYAPLSELGVPTAEALWRVGATDQVWDDTAKYGFPAYTESKIDVDEDRIRNLVRVTLPHWPATAVYQPIEVSDPSSIAMYGERADSIGSIPLVITNTISPAVLAWRRLQKSKDMKPRVTELVVQGGLDPSTQWDKILALRLSDRIAVARHAYSGHIALTVGYVDRIEHHIRHDSWDTTLQLSAF